MEPTGWGVKLGVGEVMVLFLYFGSNTFAMWIENSQDRRCERWKAYLHPEIYGRCCDYMIADTMPVNYRETLIENKSL